MPENTLSLGEDQVLNADAFTNPTPQISQKELNEIQTPIVNDAINDIERVVQEIKKKPGRPAKAASQTQTASDQILDLQNDLAQFLQDTIDIERSSGIVEKLPTGIDLLDTILGGGFGLGTFAIVVGNPGTFKSALMAQLLAACQKKYTNKFLASYFDSENAMTTERLSNLGVNSPRIKPYDDVTIETVFKTVEGVSLYKQEKNIVDYPSVIIWDSIANTSTERERTTANINETIGLRARLLSALFPRYLPKMKTNKITVIAVNQLREKMAMGPYSPAADLKWMGDKEMPGGQAIKYNAFHLLHLKSVADLKFEQYGFNGIKLEIKCIKNKFFSPNIPIHLLVDFNKGISNFWSNYNFLVDAKKLQAGAWNFLTSLPEVKFRTSEAIEKYNSNEKGFKTAFDAELTATIKSEILDKYSI